MAETTASTKRAEIQKNLFAATSELVLKAIHDAREDGDASLIEPLLQVLMDTDDETVRQSVHAMLSELKITAAEQILVDAAQDDRFADIRADILLFIWSSGLQPDTLLEGICYAAIAGDFQVAFEAQTILDTLDGPFEEEHVMAAEVVLGEWTKLPESADDPRKPLIDKMRQMLAAMHRHLSE